MAAANRPRVVVRAGIMRSRQFERVLLLWRGNSRGRNGKAAFSNTAYWSRTARVPPNHSERCVSGPLGRRLPARPHGGPPLGEVRDAPLFLVAQAHHVELADAVAL